jgi:pimeloyl-ACP methyl ester carboxylesterase
VTFPVLENVARSDRHTSFYLSCGAPEATPIIFVHGWPELAISWRRQLPVFAELGFHAVAPDMRGYGRSSGYPRHEDYAQEEILGDLMALIDHLGAEKAIWVGHDWGAPAVWTVAQHRPERCHAVANLCVPYIPDGFAPQNLIPLADRTIYPQARFPAAQWDYQLFYEENFPAACAGFEADVRAAVRGMFRAGSAVGARQPYVTALTRANGGWFGGGGPPAGVPRDERVLSAQDESAYVASLQRNGFFGPNSWYMNAAANVEFAQRARAGWRLEMPVMFLHAAYDYVCETVDSRLAEPMRAHCANLTEAVVASGHWMAQEKPALVNAHLTRWLAAQVADLWTAS